MKQGQTWLVGVLMLVVLAACGNRNESAESSASAAAATPVSVVSVAPPETEGEFDPDSGLVIDQGWKLVKGHCSACHSPKLVTQNRGTRQNWLEMIRWMQETQGLWQFDSATETTILDYLEKNYAPAAVFRRAPLPEADLPANPYAAGSG